MSCRTHNNLWPCPECKKDNRARTRYFVQPGYFHSPEDAHDHLERYEVLSTKMHESHDGAMVRCIAEIKAAADPEKALYEHVKETVRYKPVQPSNFEVKVVGAGRELFDLAIRAAFADHTTAVGWKEDSGYFYLHWSGVTTNECQALPYPVDAVAGAQVAWGWLQLQDLKGDKPDIDGSVSKDGFLVETVSEGWSYAILRVRRVWAEYHK